MKGKAHAVESDRLVKNTMLEVGAFSESIPPSVRASRELEVVQGRPCNLISGFDFQIDT